MEETARAILEVADAAMVRAIKVISVHRGQDPRDHALVAFGGAGGLHGCRLAQRLEMREVIIPRHAGLCSAMGMLQAPPMRMYSQSVLLNLEELASENDEARHRLREVEQRWVEAAIDEMGRKALKREWTASLRYVGQSFSLDLVLGEGLDGQDWERVEEVFHERHEASYGYCDRTLSVELVRCRLQVHRPLEVAEGGGGGDGEEAWSDPVEAQVEAVAHRGIDMGNGSVETPIYERQAIGEGQRIEGPAIVSEYSGTVVVLAGWEVEKRSQHLILRRGDEE